MKIRSFFFRNDSIFGASSGLRASVSGYGDGEWGGRGSCCPGRVNYYSFRRDFYSVSWSAGVCSVGCAYGGQGRGRRRGVFHVCFPGVLGTVWYVVGYFVFFRVIVSPCIHGFWSVYSPSIFWGSGGWVLGVWSFRVRLLSLPCPTVLLPLYLYCELCVVKVGGPRS